MREPFFATDAAKLDDPFEDFAWYRENEPVVYHRPLDQWFVFRHADVAALFKDERLSADRLAGMARAVPAEAQADLARIAPYFEGWVLMADGDRHRRLRSWLHEGFNPEVIRSLRGKITDSADKMLDTAAGEGRLDVAADFAFLLTAYVLADFLGVPEARRNDVVRWSMDFIDFFNVVPITAENTRKMVASGLELIDCTKALLEERRRNPAEDFLGVLARTQRDFSDGELVGNAMLLLLAGHIAVRNFIGNAVWLLLQHPRALDQVRHDPGLLRGAIDETLRFETPVAAIPRVAVEPVECCGKTIPAGSLVQLVIASANRDETVFPGADQLDIARGAGGLLSFGSGPHTCLGALLAREETEIAVDLLIRRFPDLRLDAARPPVWYRNLGNRGPEQLHVVL